MKRTAWLLFFILGFLLNSHAVPPVLNYAGQVAVDGKLYDGFGLFKFALVSADGNLSYWSNDSTSVGGSEPQASVSVAVSGGLYSILLGNTAIQGMSAIDPSIFAQHKDAKLRVWFSDGVNGFQQLSPDRPFASVPYAFSAGSAPIAQGSINHSMLSGDLRSDLNSSIKNITRDMLPDSVLFDLNRTITRDMLPSSVLADLNRTITKSNLGSDVLSDLNSSISLNRLSPEVLAALQVTPSISTQPFARYDWRTASATIEARGHGHNLSYQWLKNGEIIAGANAPVLELSNPVLDDNATYSVQLTNSVGQTTSHNITLQQAIGAPGLPLADANATQVPRNGLVLWMDANDLNADGLADNLPTGTLIDSWKSKVGDVQLSQSSAQLQPKSNNYGSTNLKAVAFDGGDYLLDDNASILGQHLFLVQRSYYEKNDIIISENSAEVIGIAESGGFRDPIIRLIGGSTRVSGYVNDRENFSSWSSEVITMLVGSSGFDGNFSKLGVGAKNSNSNHFEGELGEILFYNRALSNTERDAVERYLADKWSIQLHADKIAAEQAAYNAAKPEAEPENGLLAYYKFEPVSIEPDKLWDYSGNDRHLTISGFDGDPWVDGVDGKGLSFDGGNSKAYAGSNSGIDPGTIAFWANPVEALDASDNPNIVTYFRSGNSANQYLGFNKLIEGQGRHFALWQSSKTSTVKVGAINQAPSGWLHVAITYDENSSTYEFFLNGQPLETVHYNSGHPRIDSYKNFTIGNANAPYYRGLLDEFRIYNRSLTPAEIEGLYLQVDSPILRMAPEHNATVGTNFSLSLAADNGPTTYLAEGLPAGLSLNVTTGQISGTLSQPGYHRVFVKAMNEHGTGSDTIAIVARPQTDQHGWPEDVPDGSDIPQNGLVLWLDANDIDADGQIDTGTDHLKLANWADKAGQDHNATQANAANQPEIRSGQLADNPNQLLSVFEGNQTLDFPEITQIRTYFCVAKYSSSGNGEWTGILGGTTKWHGGSKFWSGRTSGILSNGDNRVNGSIYTSGSQPQGLKVFSGVSTEFASADIIGTGKAGYSTHFNGILGEILIFDRVLSTTEIETVEKYLGQKWGIAISHDNTPPTSGNPPTFAVTPANDSVTTAHLTEQILKYLKPEITAQPQANNVYADTNHTFSVTAEGKYLTYQWKKNGADLPGETNSTLTITDANATLHDGNYSVVVNNDFGSVESTKVSVFVANEVLDGLVGWWPLDGNASDFSGGQNHGTISGSPLWVTGKIGDAVRFNSVNQQISTNSNFGTQNSISIWCNFSSTSSGQFQMVWSFSNPNLAFNSSTVSLNSMDSSANKFADFSALQFANQWLHFVTVNTSSQTELYLNAASIGTANYVSPSTNNFVIGKGGYTLNGIVDEVRIYDRALSNTEVQTLYNLGQ